jgi:RNA polymerase sigma factor (sigma-70 family)
MKKEDPETGFESLNEPDFVARFIAGGADEFDTVCIVAGPLLQRHIAVYFIPPLNVGDVEDVIQEALLYAYKAHAKYDPKIAKLTTWLYDIAKWKAQDSIKSIERTKRVPIKRSNLFSIEDLPDKEQPAIDITTSENEPPSKKKGRYPSLKDKATLLKNVLSHLSEDEQSRRINQALMTLEERQRVILIAAIQKASSKDIAMKLGISVDNVRKIRERAWGALLSSIEEAESDE